MPKNQGKLINVSVLFRSSLRKETQIQIELGKSNSVKKKDYRSILPADK